MLCLPILPAIFQFSKCVIDDIEPVLQLFQSEHPLAVFLYQKLKTLMLNIMACFICLEILEKESSTKTLMRIDLSDHENIL